MSSSLLETPTSPLSPKRKRDSCDVLPDMPGAASPRTRRRSLSARLRPRSPFRRRTSKSHALNVLNANTTTNGNNDGDELDALSPTKRQRKIESATLEGFALRKTRQKRLLGAAQKRYFRLSGTTLSYYADDKVGRAHNARRASANGFFE